MSIKDDKLLTKLVARQRTFHFISITTTTTTRVKFFCIFPFLEHEKANQSKQESNYRQCYGKGTDCNNSQLHTVRITEKSTTLVTYTHRKLITGDHIMYSFTKTNLEYSNSHLQVISKTQ